MLRSPYKRLHLGDRMPEVFGRVPETPEFGALLDDFNRADESPLSGGGNWAKLNSADTNELSIVSNVVRNSSTLTGSRYWTPTNFGPDCFVAVRISTLAGNSQSVAVLARLQGEGGSNTWDGYQMFVTKAAAIDQWLLRVITNNAVATTLIDSAAVSASGSRLWEFATNDRIGISCVGSTIGAWVYDDSAAEWIQLGEATDATYGSAGKAGMSIQQTTARLDDFYAGTI